jgi:hypothetical protein
MKLIAVLALACGFVAAPMIGAGNASAQPSCDSKDCVPYVDHNVAQGAPCSMTTRYVFGLNAKGDTLICTGRNQWATSAPLVGVRTLRAPCDASMDKGVAQSPDGVPMTCLAQGWTADYNAIFYPNA